MSPTWRFPCLPRFVSPLDAQFSPLTDKIRNPQAGFPRAERNWAEFEEFVAGITLFKSEMVRNPDPTQIPGSRMAQLRDSLRPAREDGKEIPNCYVLAIGRWSAYFIIDHKRRVCHGVVTHYAPANRSKNRAEKAEIASYLRHLVSEA